VKTVTEKREKKEILKKMENIIELNGEDNAYSYL
jgi:hypothetical protein